METVTRAGVRVFPAAWDCDRETLLDIAALAARGDSWGLRGSSAHVEAICRLLSEEIEPELRAAEDRIRRLERRCTEEEAS
jgi:hypothetical protein